MLMRMMMAAALLVAEMTAAEAASFECAKAATPLEKAICDSPELGRSDEVLARAYATALGGLSETAKAAVQASQRQWLAYAALSCTDDAKPVSGSFTEEQASCLNAAFLTRIRELEQSRMSGGWRFYPVGSYAVLDDPEPEWWGGVASKTSSWLRLDDTVPTAASFNAAVAAAVQALGTPFDAAGKLVDEEVTSDTSVDMRLEDVTGNRIGLSVSSYWMGHGAAHGNYAISHFNYLIDRARMLEAGDLFTGADWQAGLGELVLAELDRSIEGGIWAESRGDVPALAADPTRWAFADAGLVVQFQPYEVTAYAYGAPTVTIPWSALQPHLVEGYETAVLY